MPEDQPPSLLGSLLRGALVGSVVLVLVGSRVAPLIITDQLPPPRLRGGGAEALLADLERLGKLGFFEGRGSAADAAPTLNALVGATRELPVRLSTTYSLGPYGKDVGQSHIGFLDD